MKTVADRIVEMFSTVPSEHMFVLVCCALIVAVLLTPDSDPPEQ